MKYHVVALACFLAVAYLLSGCTSTTGKGGGKLKDGEMEFEVNKTEEEWKEILTPEQFKILRKKGTERAFSSKYHDSKKKGMYICAGCENELFHSDAKYDSGTGWPSYWRPVSEKSVLERPDNSLFMRRTEIICRRCGGHLGHVFDDGPPPTGLRYCMNALAMNFIEGKENPYAEAQ